ncbi:MAG: TusE/DsrC/DsvC family sulfur relay protein [Gammaproteobacteria bacterium]|nr:TusE/DsrC/DsvC family sulfur relay protein [Gammaproteobacteria bacterium]
MSDINKYISDQSTWSEERENQLDLEEWNESIAAAKAKELGLELDEGHWEVVRFLRKHYLENGPVRAPALSDALEEQFADRGGRKYLYTLFPDGPVLQACQVAGLPVPGGTINPGFGSAR